MRDAEMEPRSVKAQVVVLKEHAGKHFVLLQRRSYAMKVMSGHLAAIGGMRDSGETGGNSRFLKTRHVMFFGVFGQSSTSGIASGTQVTETVVTLPCVEVSEETGLADLGLLGWSAQTAATKGSRVGSWNAESFFKVRGGCPC